MDKQFSLPKIATEKSLTNSPSACLNALYDHARFFSMVLLLLLLFTLFLLFMEVEYQYRKYRAGKILKIENGILSLDFWEIIVWFGINKDENFTYFTKMY